jgi:hypothetical protein
MTPQDSVARYQLEQRSKSGAYWFYWIAALSLITSFVSLAGGNWAFLTSLGVTQVIDAVARGVASKAGAGFKVVALVIDLAAALLFALIGSFAARRYAWVFIAGMALYALDALVCALVGLWLGLAFHAFVLYSIYGGYKACARLAEADRLTPPPAPEAMPSPAEAAR